MEAELREHNNSGNSCGPCSRLRLGVWDEALCTAISSKLQSLLFGLFQRGLKVRLGTVGGIEAVMAPTLILLKQRVL